MGKFRSSEMIEMYHAAGFRELYALENGIVYAEVYDSKEDKYVGYIEVCC